MNTCEDYLSSIRSRNPNLFKAAKIHIAPEELLKQIEAAYLKGRQDFKDEAAKISAGMPDFMQGLFR